MLRFGPPSKCFFRETTRPIELHGQTIPANARVMLTIAAGNRGPAGLRRADRTLVDRVCDNDHLSFGSGIHHCLGLMLARLETLTFSSGRAARARATWCLRAKYNVQNRRPRGLIGCRCLVAA
ncbi:MAG: cytochrome P450 [bacterium]